MAVDLRRSLEALHGILTLGSVKRGPWGDDVEKKGLAVISGKKGRWAQTSSII